MLSCQEMTEVITDYLEGRMSLMQRMSFQMHVGMCRQCRAYLRQVKVTVRTLGHLPEEAVPMPEAVQRELGARLRAFKEAQAGRSVANGNLRKA